MQFDVIINTPHGLYKKTRASIVNVVSTDGQRGILPNHMPIVVSLAVGKMTIEERERETYAISGDMDQYPESAFFNVGTIDDVIAKAKTL